MNYKIRVNIEAESKEVQELFFALGGVWSQSKNASYIADPMTYVYFNGSYIYYGHDDENDEYWFSCESSGKEITIQQLKDLVVLKRNSIDDATHIRGDGKKYFHAESTDYFYQFSDDNEWILSTWMNYQLLPQLKPIEKKEMKEYLVQEYNGTYKLQLAHPLTAWKSWIEVPEGANIYTLASDGLYAFWSDEYQWTDGVITRTVSKESCFSFEDWKKEWSAEILWQRDESGGAVEELMTEDNQIIVDTQIIVDVNPIFGHSDLFDKIRKGEISFDFSEMKTERDEDVVENFKPPKISDLFKDDCERGSSYPKMKAERKAIIVTITPNDVKTKWFEKFLHGVKVQCRVIGTKGWQNMTWKSLEKMKLNIEFREKPKTIEVDGMKFDTVDKLTSYLKSMTNLK